MYFQQFPVIYYPFNIKGADTFITVKDITLNIRIIKEVLNNITLYNAYSIEDGETPDIIAEKIYGNPALHWTIMLANDRYDYVNDYPVSAAVLEKLVEEKYGVGKRNAQHYLFGRKHYISPDNLIVDSTYPNALPVTNYDYEAGENEKKRNIRLISPDIISTFVQDIQDVFRKNV